MRATVVTAALICFASFGWGMVRHFERVGKPKPGMLFVGLVAPVFAGMHVFALFTRPLAHAGIALILYTAGLTLFWFAVAATRGRGLAFCFQGHVPPMIIRTGPYRAIRHPFYTAYTLVWVAGFVATGWGPLAAIAILMASLYTYSARQEEAGLLRSAFGEEYRAYRRQAGAFLPRFLPRIKKR